jgi:hypothetical protein
MIGFEFDKIFEYDILALDLKFEQKKRKEAKMPNIEIYGFSSDEDLRVLGLKISIGKVMKSLGLEYDAITTVVNSSTHGCNGKADPMPFIRVCSTDPVGIEKIVNALKKERIGRQNVDIETLVLSGFILAKCMK